ncbi:MAG: flagellar hook capping FlgD N-terminal domain-containing protein [Thermodesulfovibrionaceae bacterium]
MSEVTTIFNNPAYIWQNNSSVIGNNKIDKEAFLNLLVAQLRYQDPLNPLKDHEFLGQLTQMSMLEQLMNMNSIVEDLALYEIYSNALMIGSMLIGKTVVTVDGKEYIVEGIAIEDGKLKIKVNENEYISMNQIKEIRA